MMAQAAELVNLPTDTMSFAEVAKSKIYRRICGTPYSTIRY